MVQVHPDPPSSRGRLLGIKLSKVKNEAAVNAVVFTQKRGISSIGRAPALQAGGRRFDSVILHHCIMSGEGEGSEEVMVNDLFTGFLSQ